jgi:hypothetical protein
VAIPQPEFQSNQKKIPKKIIKNSQFEGEKNQKKHHDKNVCPDFCCVNKAHLVTRWRNTLMDGLLHRFGLIKSAKAKDGL